MLIDLMIASEFGKPECQVKLGLSVLAMLGIVAVSLLGKTITGNVVQLPGTPIVLYGVLGIIILVLLLRLNMALKLI